MEGLDEGVGKSIAFNMTVDVNHGIDAEDDKTVVGDR